jgi:nitrogen-specific signal transduction histidine kinase
MRENFGSAAELWADEQAALVRGLAHALSNRVGTVVAAVGLLAVGEPAPEPLVVVLHGEGDRLEELLGLMRLLAGDGGGGAPEPIHLPDIVTPAVALHSHHPAHRDVPCEVVPDPLAPPVRAPHTGLARALLVLLSAAKQGRDGGAVVRWAAVGDEVALLVDGAPGDELTAAAASSLVGTPVVPTPAGYEARLPRI